MSLHQRVDLTDQYREENLKLRKQVSMLEMEMTALRVIISAYASHLEHAHPIHKIHIKDNTK